MTIRYGGKASGGVDSTTFGLLVGENGLSENQFGLRRGKPTLDAIQAVVDIAANSRRGTGNCKGMSRMTIFCACNYLLERASSSSRMTHLCVSLKTTGSLS